jgi:GPH family glycoside/pentoside/hexuronide:cation symporter
MLYTGMNVPFGSLASVITDDPDGRTLLSTFRTIGSGVGGAAPALLAPFLIYTTVTAADGSTYNVADGPGMFKFALVMGILSIIFYFACYGMTKERVPSEAEPKVNMKQIYGGMLKSKPFVVLALTGILISGQLQFASLNQYLYKNYFENTGLGAIGTIANYLPMAVMLLFVPKLVKKFGKKYNWAEFTDFEKSVKSKLRFLNKKYKEIVEKEKPIEQKRTELRKKLAAIETATTLLNIFELKLDDTSEKKVKQWSEELDKLL